MTSDTPRRRMVEADPEIAELVRLYCFLRGMTVKAFVTRTLREAVEPYRAWIESVRRLTPPR